jgi:hypothetical protein
MIRTGALAVALLTLATTLRPQSAEVIPQGEPQRRVTFGVGELLEYDVRVAIVHGSASLEIVGLDTIRGRPAWHTVSKTRGGMLGIRVNDRLDSWIDVNTISTLRYKEDVSEANYKRKRDYEFYPDQKLYIEGTDTTQTVDRPVDQTSIFYLLRTLDLRPGLDTSFSNYFMVDRNPIRLIVLGREHISVPAGDFETVIVRPIIKAKGLFSEGGDARVWISDDDRRIVVQVKAKVPGLPFGGMNMYLKTYRPPNGTAPRLP